MSKRFPTKPFFIGGLTALVGALGGAISVSYYVVDRLIRPVRPGLRETYTFTPFEFGVPFEPVEFAPASGEHTVHGWFLACEGTQRVIVLCPGYRGQKADLLGIGMHLWREGNNVLLFDYHGHGYGWGVPVTLGFREINDVLGALDYVQQRVPGAVIGLLGYSMGAAVAIMGAARRPEVRAVVADSPFATHWGVVEYNFKRVARLPAAPFLLLADRLMAWRAGYRFREVEPLRDVVRIAPHPLLLIHGLNDTIISPQDSQRLFEAAGDPKELWLVEGMEHCCAYFKDRQAYCQRLAAFFATHLGRCESASPMAASAGLPATQQATFSIQKAKGS
ncbi:MAG TPA: alpha/beta fold hydrolase [Ktedonobacterales bacterium]|nr:alpha/beta fold hydrolase [Ktedonobacterales bacterium]